MTPYHDYHVGQDVVCIDASNGAHSTMPFELTEGTVYRLRWVGMHKRYVEGEYLGVKLEGVHRGTCPEWGDEDPPFAAKRFRPLVPDRLASFRQAAADPHGPVQGDVDGPKRKVKEEEKV